MCTMCILIIRYLRLNSPFCTDGLGLLCLLHSKGCSSSCMKEVETEVGGELEVEGNGEVKGTMEVGVKGLITSFS